MKFLPQSANKSLPIHSISWARTDKSDQQKADRRKPAGQRKIKKKC